MPDKHTPKERASTLKGGTLRDITNTSRHRHAYPKQIEHACVMKDEDILDMLMSDDTCDVYMYDEMSE